MNKNRILPIIFAVILLAAALALYIKAALEIPELIPAEAQSNQVPPALSADMELLPQQMKADLDYLTDALLKTHPKTVRGFSDYQKKVIKQAYAQVTSPKELTDFFFIANSIICTFNDPHTSAYDRIDNGTAMLKAYFQWFADGFYCISDCGELHKGDKLISIGGMEAGTLLEKLGGIIPHENEFWLHTMAQNKIHLAYYLSYLGIDTSQKGVKVVVERNGLPVEAYIPFITASEWNNNIPSRDYTACEYKIDTVHDLGYLRMDECTDNAAYQEALKSLFGEVSKQRIGNIVVDLRNNTGGNSRVANRFIQYLDVPQYNDFSSYVRYSPLAKKQNKYPSDSGEKVFGNGVEKNQITADKSLIFNKKVYLLTSNKTFSSANMFAVYFKDNKLGTIVGEETGNSPSACGDVISAQLPNSRIVFGISHKIFHRPDETKDEDTTLYPDILVRTTIDDYLAGRDPVMQRVYELIH